MQRQPLKILEQSWRLGQKKAPWKSERRANQFPYLAIKAKG
jgi:hypothetical protein